MENDLSKRLKQAGETIAQLEELAYMFSSIAMDLADKYHDERKMSQILSLRNMYKKKML